MFRRGENAKIQMSQNWENLSKQEQEEVLNQIRKQREEDELEELMGEEELATPNNNQHRSSQEEGVAAEGL